MRPLGGRRLAVEAVGCGVAVGLTVLLVDLGSALDLGDEAFQYLMSRSWARGESLFDRQVLYPVGQHVVYGTFLRLFGEGLWVIRLGGAVLGGVAAAILFAMLRLERSPALACALPLAAAMCWKKPERALAAVLVVAAAVWLGRTLERSPAGVETTAEEPSRAPRRWLGATALLAGGLAGWREDGAFLALVLAGLGVLLRRRPRELFTVVLPGVVAGLAPWIVVVAVRGDALPFLQHLADRFVFLFWRLSDPTDVLWRFPPQRLPRRLGELGQQVLPFVAFMPPAFYAGVLVWQARRLRHRQRLHLPLVAAVVVGMAYLPQFLWERPDLAHFRGHLPVFLAAVAVGAAGLAPRQRGVAAAGLVVLALVGGGLQLVQRWRAQPVPYPCCGGERIGAKLGAVPPWAGLEHSSGETLIALWWGPGWYVLEDIEPGTRFLSTFSRHLRSRALRDELVRDLEEPTNRWVISPHGRRSPEVIEEALRRHYGCVARWRGWRLWERGAHPAPPCQSDR